MDYTFPRQASAIFTFSESEEDTNPAIVSSCNALRCFSSSATWASTFSDSFWSFASSPRALAPSQCKTWESSLKIKTSPGWLLNSHPWKMGIETPMIGYMTMHGNSLWPIREWQLEFRPRRVRGNKDLQLYCKWKVQSGQCAKEVSKVIIPKQRQWKHVITHHNICTEKIFWLPSPHLSILKNHLGFPCVVRTIALGNQLLLQCQPCGRSDPRVSRGTQSGLVKVFGWPMTKNYRITCLKLIAHTRIYIYMYQICILYSPSLFFFTRSVPNPPFQIYRAARRPASHGVSALHLWRFEAPQEPGSQQQTRTGQVTYGILTFGMGRNIPSFTCGFGDFLFGAGTRNRFQMQPLPDKLCHACAFNISHSLDASTQSARGAVGYLGLIFRCPFPLKPQGPGKKDFAANPFWNHFTNKSSESPVFKKRQKVSKLRRKLLPFSCPSTFIKNARPEQFLTCSARRRSDSNCSWPSQRPTKDISVS